MGFGSFVCVGVAAVLGGGLLWVREALRSGVERYGSSAAVISTEGRKSAAWAWRYRLVGGCYTRMRASSKAVMYRTSFALGYSLLLGLCLGT